MMLAENTVPFEGTLWHLAGYVTEAGETVAAKIYVENPSIQFSEGRIGGNATCNRFFGAYSLIGDRLTIQPGGSTLMACPEEFMVQEQEFLAALGQVASYVMTADQLQLLDRDGNIRLTFDQAVPPALTNTLWQLTAYNNGQGGVVSVIAGTRIAATFDANGGLTGFAGCNNYMAGYSVTGDAIEIGSAVSTRKFCNQPAGVMVQESAYLQALETAATYSVEGNVLSLRTATGAMVAQFRAAEMAN
jgi:heat shock protein HslJ